MQRLVTRTTPSWDPFTALSRMDRDFDEMVRRSFPRQGAVRSGFIPAVEIRREAEDVLVVLELPGIDVQQDVGIEVDRGKLVISGERRDQHGEDAENVLVRELRYGSFRREFALPGGVSPEQVEATYDAGLLSVRVRGVIQPEPVPVKVPITTGRADQPQIVEGSAE